MFITILKDYDIVGTKFNVVFEIDSKWKTASYTKMIIHSFILFTHHLFEQQNETLVNIRSIKKCLRKKILWKQKSTNLNIYMNLCVSKRLLNQVFSSCLTFSHFTGAFRFFVIHRYLVLFNLLYHFWIESFVRAGFWRRISTQVKAIYLSLVFFRHSFEI